MMSRKRARPFQSVSIVLLLALACIAPQGERAEPAAKPATTQGLSDAAGVPDAVRAALLARDWTGAARTLERLEREQSDDVDWWMYLRATALARAGELGAAIALFSTVESREGSRWRTKARFARAEALRAQGRSAEAERIFEDEANRLLSERRQEELAAIYFGFADELSTARQPAPLDAKPLDPQRASALYRRVLDLDVSPRSRERALHRLAFCAHAAGNPSAAVDAAREHLAEFGPDATGGPGDRVFDVLLLRARALHGSSATLEARHAFEDLIVAIREARDGVGRWSAWRAQRTEPQQAELAEIDAQAHFELAATFAGVADADLRAIGAYERFLERFPTHARAAEALFAIAELHRKSGRDEDAIRALDRLLARGDAADDPAARERDAWYARRALFQKGETLARQAKHDAAIAVFAEYVAKHTTGADWGAAQQAIVEAEHARSRLAFEQRDFEKARELANGFLERHPLDPRAAQIAFDVGLAFAEQARDLKARAGEAERARIGELFAAAIAQWRRVVGKHAQTNEASRALLSIGELRESELGDLEGAVAAYRECTFGSSASQALMNIARMTEPSLTVVTERVHRSNEKPRIKVWVRNVEKLSIDVFALDLDAYFRKHLAATGIEDLDLDLISPDRRVEVAVAGYAKYKPIEQELELPVDGPGVWAIAVTAGEMRATTLVVQSDLEIVVRGSRAEVLMFAQDARAKVAAEGARIVLAGRDERGEPVTIELETGKDGVARKTFEKPVQASSLAVLARRGKHVAIDGNAPCAVVATPTSTPRGVVYTDRPIYRPGERVHWRAIVRGFADGRLVAREGERWRVEVRDPAAQTISTSEAATSRFGTLHGELVLDELAPTGAYQVWVSDAEGVVHAAGFQVDRFQTPKARLDLSTPREIYFRGERVEVEALAQTYWGEPIAAAPVRVSLPDGRSLELSTDAAGKARFGFETRDLAELGEVAVIATLTTEQASARASVWLARVEYSASVSVDRGVVLAGSSLGVAIATRSVDDTPTARELSLRVLRLTTDARGASAEVELAKHALTTDAAGEAHHAFVLNDGGWHVLRAEGLDRFGNLVAAEARVFVSGEDDPRKLRMVVASHRLKVGERARIELVNRGDESLGLITTETDSIRSYRIVRLARGSNSFELDVEHAHHPGVDVAAAMIDGDRLHEDAASFDVARELVVTLAPDQPTYEPGKDATVAIRVVDQLGRPVEAELSVGVIDEALYDAYADGTPALDLVFGGFSRRRANLVTSSSAAFRYDAQTRVIAAAVLAEASRREREQRWNEQRGQLLDSLRAGEELAMVSREDQYFLGAAAKDEAEADGQLATGAPSQFAARRGRGGKARGPASPGPSTAKSSAPPLAAPAEPRFAPELAFWSPNVVTDASGKASVTFPAPSTSSRWRITARGADLATSIGEARASFVTRAEFFVELRAPGTLTEGDAPRIVARVHNLTGLTGTATLRLRAVVGSTEKVYPREIEIGAEPSFDVVFPALDPMSAASELRLELDAQARLDGVAAAGTHAATITERPYASTARAAADVAIRPWGIELADAKSGILRGSRSLDLALPRDTAFARRRLEIVLGVGVDRLLVATALDQDQHLVRPASPQVAETAGDLFGACALLELLGKSGRLGNPELVRLRARAQGLVARLIAQQTAAGWRWAGPAGDAHVESTALAMIALAKARAAAIVVRAEAFDQGRRALAELFRAAPQQADEAKALLSWARAACGDDDFGALNRLHRERGTLSTAALAYTTLALAEADRGPMALEVAEALERAATIGRDDAPVCRFDPRGNGGWNRSSLETTALAVLALERAKPTSDRIAAGVEFLLRARPWSLLRARGLCVAAIAEQRTRSRPELDRVRVSIAIAGGETRVVDLAPDALGETISIELPATAPAKQTIALELKGRGETHYSARLIGFATELEHERQPFRFWRQLHHALPASYAGRELPTGFGVLVDATETWTNEVNELGLGVLTRVELGFVVRGDRDERSRDDYWMLDIPLPAGARLLEGSVRTSLPFHELRDGRIVAHVGQIEGSGHVEYTLIGAAPGAYRVPPPVLRDVDDPERVALGAPRSLTVLARGETSRDAYRPTPDELFARGEAQFAAGDLEAARQSLQALLDAYEAKLRDGALSSTARMLLEAHVARKDAREIVRCFEILKEKDPELYLTFDRVMAVGAAYREIEEFERASSIFRAVAEEAFGKELRVVGALEEQRELDGALRTLARLVAEYPDAAAVVQSELALADKLLLLAARVDDEPSLRAAGRTRGALALEGIAALQRLLARFPDDPLAPEVALSLVAAHLGLRDYAAASRLGGELAAHFREPRFADALLYSRAVAEWYLGHDREAADELQRIATAQYEAADGRKIASENRSLALYILGQIHHAAGRHDLATGFYEQVQEEFADARETLETFRERRLRLEELVAVEPGARATLELWHKNVAAVEYLAYPVDLMTLYLREKNLARVAKLNLSGIAPPILGSIELAPSGASREAKHRIELALEDPGAYLVICRGGDLHASALVLASGIELDVQEDASGHVRVGVFDRKTGAAARDVDVRVIGSQNDGFVAGLTDPRGVFVADGIRGTATVIARRGDREYAFHRGSRDLAQVAPPRDRQPAQRQGEQDYLRNVLELNEQAQEQRGRSFDAEWRRERKGVQVRQVK